LGFLTSGAARNRGPARPVLAAGLTAFGGSIWPLEAKSNCEKYHVSTMKIHVKTTVFIRDGFLVHAIHGVSLLELNSKITKPIKA